MKFGENQSPGSKVERGIHPQTDNMVILQAMPFPLEAKTS
jgi:hypothetical protein